MNLRTISLSLFAALLLVNCKQKQETPVVEPTKQETTMPEEAVPTLKSELDARKDNFNAKADEDVKTDYANGLKAVEESGVVEQAKHVGEKAPDFTLKNAVGETVTLSDYLKKDL
ncbi:redoxin domain-containing protein [Formosa haliotis]|uniref:redoxin domain-containing protein n=1 Tax=Formosa haliotis TaxID=1555194 RepID=UPI001F3C5E12|nr:redoxin domain-containing protein [Formosa haliotis]